MTTEFPAKRPYKGDHLDSEAARLNIVSAMDKLSLRIALIEAVQKLLLPFDGKKITKRLATAVMAGGYSCYYEAPESKFGAFGNYKLTVWYGPHAGGSNEREVFYVGTARNAEFNHSTFIAEARLDQYRLGIEHYIEVLTGLDEKVKRYNDACDVFNKAIGQFAKADHALFEYRR